jgi:coiled-coil and C2 domain-containing protein 2A
MVIRTRFHRHCVDWEANLRASRLEAKDRHFAALVVDIERQPQVVCSYVYPMRPPDQRQAVFRRFVSQIPFKEDHELFEGSSSGQDIWCTAAQFLIMGNGDWEEHAILLCNYYLYWDQEHPLVAREGVWRTYVVLGHGAPEGKTAYVMRMRLVDNGSIKDIIFINPVTGIEYSRDDYVDTLPLRDVGCVFNADNVWVNIQSEKSVSRLNFNLLSDRHWTPLLREEKRFADFRTQLQAFRFRDASVDPRYYDGDFSLYTTRAARIERLLQAKLEQWRDKKETFWNHAGQYPHRPTHTHNHSIHTRVAEIM